jgi:CheY-like chemotaxis protein
MCGRSRAKMKRLSILIADRTPEYCAQVSRWLHAHDTTCVHSTDEALSATGLLQFDVVVSATLSDDLDGTDAIRKLKQRQRWTRLLAVINEKDDDQVRREFGRAIRAGADAAVRRSIDEKQFLLAFRACWHDVPPSCAPVSARTDFTLSRV